MKFTLTRFAVPAVAVALLLGACSSDGDDDATATAPQEQTQSTDAPETTDSMSSSDSAEPDDSAANDSAANDSAANDSDIVDTAVTAGEFETLVAAVQAAGLEEALRGDGPYTVFAPTDAAFAALPAGTVATLLEDPTGDLADILTYHVVEGAVMAADVVELNGQPVTTVNGASFTVNVADDGTVSLTDASGATVGVVTTDIETSNGVIHVIDGVLMPA